MAVISRQTVQSPLKQGEDETIAYTITTTPWASSPTSVAAKIYSFNPVNSSYTEVTSARMTGSPSVTNDVITLPAISGLTDGTRYRVEVQFTVSGNIYEPWFWLDGER